MFDNLIHNPTSFRDSSSKVKVKVKVKCGKTFPQIFVLSTFSPWQRYFSSFFFNRCSVLHFHLRQLILVAFLWQKTQVGRADIGNKKKKKRICKVLLSLVEVGQKRKFSSYVVQSELQHQGESMYDCRIFFIIQFKSLATKRYKTMYVNYPVKVRKKIQNT